MVLSLNQNSFYFYIFRSYLVVVSGPWGLRKLNQVAKHVLIFWAIFFEPFHWSRLITLYVADVYKRQGILEVIKLQIASSVIYAINLTEPELEDFEEKVKGFVTQERKNTQNIKSTL